MVSRHASNEEVEQEGLLGIGAVEHGELVVCVGDNLFSWYVGFSSSFETPSDLSSPCFTFTKTMSGLILQLPW